MMGKWHRQLYGKLLKLAVLTVLLSLMSTSLSAKQMEETWTEVLYFTSSSGFPVPADEGRYVGNWEMRGIATFEDGTVAKMQSTGTMSLVRGTGPYSGYVLYTFDDGSTKFGKIQGAIVKSMPDGGNVQEGTLSYEGGTGRFSGLKGGGTFHARQYGAAKDGGETLIDVVARLLLPD